MSNNMIKFVHRTASNTSDKRIADLFNKGPSFDVDLVTSDEKKVSAHRLVLALYSKHLAGQIHDSGLNGLLIIPLTNYPFEIVQKIVQLLYFREVVVPVDLTAKMKDALNFLKIHDTNVTMAEQEQFKKPNAPPLTQRKVVSQAQKPASAPMQQQQQQLSQQKLIRLENGAAGEQIGSYTPGKRKRAQSTFVSGTPRDPDLVAASRIPNGVGNQNGTAMAFARNLPHLSISKVQRTQPPSQPQPQSVSSLSTTPNPAPVKQQNVGPKMVEKPEQIALPLTASSPTPVKNPNVAATMQTPEQMITPNVQPQQPMRPTTIPNLPASITLQKVAATAEKSNILQNGETTGQTDEIDEPLNKMESDEPQFEDEIVDESDEEAGENEGIGNGSVEQNDLRDIFPELRDDDTQ
ncbi:uncharacterized protein LOC129577670 isoform X1 [Sitodiplosis mosellana]|uniref:uncharacterized protein LOC129577670 isoform X1 n=1 Tax=Sitodiplosis mosellana TaxID=263140 RepID=UPI002443994A|nr:uncharacterized protein LOC129577670 isoform X1 [Sitodiplosis mosellana]